MAFELPESLSALSPEELQALIDQGLDAFRALSITAESDEDTVVEGERIAPLITQVRAEQRSRETAEERRTRAANLLQSMETPEEPQPEPQPEPETPAEPEGVITPDEVIPAGEPVAASGRPSPARRAAANSTPPAVPRPTSMVASIVAASDVPGIPTSAPLEGLSAAAKAVISRMKGLPTHHIGGPDGVRQRYGAAVIHKQGYGELVQGQSGGFDDYDLIQAAGNERRLPGGSLVSAGGWCSPSETVFDLCQFEQVAGILDVPEIGIPRGGIRWTQGPDFGDIYQACGFFLTEAEAVAGTAEKDCCMVECPPFDEIRADAIGLCVKAPLLTQATYPELVRRFMEGALVAQQHKVNKFIIDQIVMAAGTASTATDMTAISVSLSGIAYTAIGMRYRYRMSDTESIEVVAPFWLKALIKEDLGMRQMPPEVSDAAINSWFTDRNLSPQWVYDYQDPDVDGCQIHLPATVTVLMYPAGTWVKGSIDVINIDAVYDSTGLADNVYTALFVEEGILAVQRCTHTCAVTIPVCVSGRTAINNIDKCLVAPTGGTTGGESTGATAGAPGTWTPGGTTIQPANAAEANSEQITASPATAWTTGQYVQGSTAGAPGEMHWTGSTWATGKG